MKIQNYNRVDKVFNTLGHKIDNFLGAGENRRRGGSAIIEITKNFPSWQYNGAAPFDDVLDWCEETLGDNFVWSYETIFFKHEKDRTAFMLRWA